ncbi:putative ribonuclease H-like domain-containing protein [Tanacetum coccineum]
MKEKRSDKNEKEDTRSESERLNQREIQTKHTNNINTVSTPVSTAGPSFDNAVPSPPVDTAGPSVSTANALEEHLFERFSPFKCIYPSTCSKFPDTSFTKFHKDHHEDQVIGSLKRPVQTRHMTKIHEEHEPKKPVQALKDPSWVEAMQDELIQFKLLKKDERGIVVKNKARLVAQEHTQEEGIDYDEVFAPVTRIKAIRLFMAYASFKDFLVYQMDVKSAFLYGKIEEEVYVYQPPGFEDPHFPDKVYKVEKALYGLHQAPRPWYETLSTYLLDNGFHRGQINKTLFIKRHKDDILLVQVYVDDIIFGSTKKEMTKTASTLMETNKALIKDEEAEDVDVHLYRSMIGSLIYLTTYRPNIMFDVCACARDSPFYLEAFSDSDYVGASLDRKSTTEGCQFLGKRLVSWQCKKQTIVANSTTEAEYVAVANCYG